MKPRLLFLLSRFLDGGIDTILVEYLRNIPADRYDVTLAIGTSMGELELHRSRIPQHVRVVHLVSSPMLTHWRKAKIKGPIPAAAKLLDEAILNPIRTIAASRKLRRLTSWADAIIDFDATFYTMLKRCCKPIVGFYHFSIEENLRRNRRHTMRQMHGMAGYSHIVLISDVMVDEGRRLFPELSDKFVRIYNGYNLRELRQRGAAPLQMSLSRPYFVAVERLEESQKDITTLLHAYAQALQQALATGRKLPALAVVGAGRDAARLKAIATDLGLDSMVTFTGFQPDAAPFIANSLALLHSSKYEGFGLVLAEAMILGRPVAATDCPSGPAELLLQGQAGVLTPVGDADAMADAITRLAFDTQFHRSMTEAAQRRASDFDITESVNQLLTLCQNRP